MLDCPTPHSTRALPGQARRAFLRDRLGPLAVAGSLSVMATALPAVPAAAQVSQTVTVSRVPLRSGATGWLGLGFQYREIRGTSSIRIGSVWKGGPAERSGLRTGDLLVQVNGVPARMEMIQSLLTRLAPGDPVSLTVRRSSGDLQIALQADPRPATATLVLEEMQTQLDSVRSVISTRLDSLPGPRSGPLPVLRVRPLEENDTSITLFVMVESDGTTRTESSFQVDLDSIRTNHLVWKDPVPVRVDGASTAFNIRAAQGTSEAPVQIRGEMVIRSDASSAPTPVVLRSTPPSPSTGGNLPTRGTVSMTPNSYVFGLNRVAGAALQEVDDRLEVYLGISRGLLVTEVTEGTPAAYAGLQSGDIVVEADSTTVTTIDELRRILSIQVQGHDLTVLRKGVRRTIALRR